MAIKNVHVDLVGGHSLIFVDEAGSSFMEAFLHSHDQGIDGMVIVDVPTIEGRYKNFVDINSVVHISVEEVD